MDYITSFIDALIELSNAMSIYIIFGLLFAGVLHEIVPDTLVTKHLGDNSILSVIKSTIFGIPLPVCSCGVIPIATSIKKSGASKGATLSFLISTPITGIDSIMATYGVFGWLFTIYRVITSIVIAIVAGIFTNIFDKKDKIVKPKFSPIKSGGFGVKPTSFNLSPKQDNSCCSVTTKKKRFSIINALRYSFITLLGDIAKPLFWGLLIGALITVAIPKNLSDILLDYSWLSYLIVITIAVPMYVCATASLPIAAGLILSGVSAGAGFVFLSAGPATNTVTIGVVKKMLGKRSLYIYLGTIILGSILFGVGLDYLFNSINIDAKSLVHLHEEYGIISIISSIILWGFIGYFLVKSIRSQFYAK